MKKIPDKKITKAKYPETFYIHTLGCKTNQSESDSISRDLINRGLRPAGLYLKPDLIIINTCTVTSSADKKSRQFIRRIINKYPSSIGVVTGCFTVFNKEFIKKTGLDYIIGNEGKNVIPQILGLKQKLDQKPLQNRIEEKYSAGHSRALIKIQDGCEQRCSYCIIPFVRGNYRSSPYDGILNEIRMMDKEGHDEIVLTGIHIGKYGFDFTQNNNGVTNLYDLLERILRDTSIKRIRLGSLEINELTDDIIELISRANGRIARHLHIPLQSGSDTILKKMNRPYNSQYFLSKIARLKKVVPEIVLTTDIIIGFPYETGEDFLKSFEMVKNISFTKIHVFKFSKREHTGAFLMEKTVDSKEVNSRSEKLRKLGEFLRKNFISSIIGKKLDVICDKYDDKSKIARGVSEQYVRVYFDAGYDDFLKIRGKIIRVLAVTPFCDGIKGTVIDFV
jgi:threonylcarbamoyladenosine tRNA methylthiotransferase MtaB